MVLNRDKALERLDYSQDLYQKIVEYFIKDYSDFPSRIKDLIAQRDKEAFILVHSLKNIAASLGAESLSNHAQQLETCLKESDFTRGTHELNSVLSDFSLAKKEIESLPFKKKKKRRDDLSVSGSYRELLNLLAEGLESYSPGEVEKAVNAVQQSWSLVPVKDRYILNEILSLSNDFRYLEGEEKLAELLAK